jgi:hypothetical protein
LQPMECNVQLVCSGDCTEEGNMVAPGRKPPRYCMSNDSGLSCGPNCGQWDAERGQCSHVTTADALTRIAVEAEWLRAQKQRERTK